MSPVERQDSFSFPSGGTAGPGLLVTPAVHLRYAATLEKFGHHAEAEWIRALVTREYPEHR